MTTPLDAAGLLAELSEAIASGEPDAVLSHFAPGDGVVLFGSEEPEIAYGRYAVEALWRRVLGRGQRYRWRWRDERARVAGDLAWVSALATVDIDAGGEQRQVPYRVTLVLRPVDGRWLIEHWHGSEPARPW